MEKRGQSTNYLGEETLKVLIALLAIAALIFLSVSIYHSITTSKELEQAQATLPTLMTAAVKGQVSFSVYNPSGWFIASFPDNNELPKSCTDKGWQSCICICEKDNPESTTCQNDGVCADNRGFTVIGGPIEISNPPITLNINQQLKKISKK